MAAAVAGGEAAAKNAPEQLPLNFGKRLAHTDKVVRDKGFRTLKTWLKNHPELERLDYMKLWKGLHFGMWMADKRPVQQELAVNMALMINDIPKDKQIVWIDSFWETMEEAWEKLDTHRMSKYMLFARVVVAELFKVLREQGWEADRLRDTGRTFTRATAVSGISGPNVHSLGLLLHFTRLFWEELKPQLGERPKATPEAIMVLLEPFCILAERSYSDALVKSINKQMLVAAPAEFAEELFARVTVAVETEGVPKNNRQALRESATALGAPAPEQLEDEDDRSIRKRKAFGSFQPKDKKDKPKKKAKKIEAAAERGSGSNGSNSGAMSPLVLPKAAVPDDSCPTDKKVNGKKNRQGTPAKKAAAVKKKGAKASGGKDSGGLKKTKIAAGAAKKTDATKKKKAS